MKMDKVKKFLDDYYGFDIATKCRKVHFIKARANFFYFCRELVHGSTYEAMAKTLGKDHATAIHAIKTYESVYLCDENFRKESDMIGASLKEMLPNYDASVHYTKQSIFKTIVYLENKVNKMQKELNNYKELLSMKENKQTNDFKDLYKLGDDVVHEFISTRYQPYLRMKRNSVVN